MSTQDVTNVDCAHAAEKIGAAVAALCDIDDRFPWVADEADRMRLRTEFGTALGAVLAAEDLLAYLADIDPPSWAVES